MRVCMDGFQREFIDEQQDMYAIAFSQNIIPHSKHVFLITKF